MNELDREVAKQKYMEYKEKHYEDEREMRKMLKLKKILPSVATETNWQKDYKELNSQLSDGLYYYNELKKMLSAEELKAFVEEVKHEVMKKRFLTLKLDKLDSHFSEKFKQDEVEWNEIAKQSTEETEKLEPALFAKKILEEKDLFEKVKIILHYQKATIHVFFDTTSIMKAELARLFMEKMKIREVEQNIVITACLVYAFKRTNSPMEIERIKTEKEKDKAFLQELGFDERFCKICSEYNRYNQPENYVREKEGDILELIDKMVGLLMHREDRPAFPVNEALEVLETKILADAENQYEESFKKFIISLEKIEVLRFIGIVTFLANSVNRVSRHDFANTIETILKIRELTGGNVSEDKIMKLEKIEKLQDKISILQFLQKTNEKTSEKIASLSKILRGYKNLSEDYQG